MKSSAREVKLASVDDLFTTEENRQDAAREKVMEIPLGELFPFPDHPFSVRDDDTMKETVESVKEYGVLMPAIARPREGGGYELVSGHRRKRACELAGLETMPVIVRDLDRDTAITGWNLTAAPMGEPPRMTEKQFSRAKKLLRRLCANYDHGNCLLLDDGYDPCPCPQLLTCSLVCKYFRAAVLPNDRELWAKILGGGPTQRCFICGKPIYRASNAAKYCVNCAARERRKKDAARKRKKRLDVRKSGL